jgi:hypothetical protein
MLGFATIFGRCRIELETDANESWPCQPVFKKTGSETGFLALNLDRLLDRDFEGRITDRKAEQAFKTETGF